MRGLFDYEYQLESMSPAVLKFPFCIFLHITSGCLTYNPVIRSRSERSCLEN